MADDLANRTYVVPAGVTAPADQTAWWKANLRVVAAVPGASRLTSQLLSGNSSVGVGFRVQSEFESLEKVRAISAAAATAGLPPGEQSDAAKNLETGLKIYVRGGRSVAIGPVPSGTPGFHPHGNGIGDYNTTPPPAMLIASRSVLKEQRGWSTGDGPHDAVLSVHLHPTGTGYLSTGDLFDAGWTSGGLAAVSVAIRGPGATGPAGSAIALQKDFVGTKLFNELAEIKQAGGPGADAAFDLKIEQAYQAAYGGAVLGNIDSPEKLINVQHLLYVSGALTYRLDAPDPENTRFERVDK